MDLGVWCCMHLNYWEKCCCISPLYNFHVAQCCVCDVLISLNTQLNCVGVFLCDAVKIMEKLCELIYYMLHTIYPEPNLWFVLEEGFINLHNDARPTEYDVCPQKHSCAHFSQPLEIINGCLAVCFCIFHSISHRAVPGPQVREEQPFLGCKRRQSYPHRLIFT